MSRVQIGVAVACGLLVAAVGFGLYSGRVGGGGEQPAPRSGEPSSVPPAQTSQEGATTGAPSVTGERSHLVTAEVEDVMLSPSARILAERFKCVCGCDDILATCSCEETPGSRDMKKFLQELVDGGKTPTEVEAAMVEKYGEAVRP